MSTVIVCDGEHPYAADTPIVEVRAIVHVAESRGLELDFCREHLVDYFTKLQWEPTLAVTVTPRGKP